jgi:SAM-dependent methyltransferase
MSVLDVGAGDGRASLPWFEHRVCFTAVDASAQMLSRLRARATDLGLSAETHVGGAGDFLRSAGRTFDVVSHVSMLHHVPEYVGLLEAAVAAVAPGGCLLTFQDPLRYDRLPGVDHAADRAAYFAWRLAQGNLRQGMRTRLRRLRGRYDASEAADYEEYHVVRNGVDSEVILGRLASRFAEVREVRYWATQAAPWQTLGERLGLRNCFGILALGRRPI